MISVDLSSNSLDGLIPMELGRMDQVLSLAHNQLTGTIAESFAGLRTIDVLDLSHNQLTGQIPGTLGTLAMLSDLDVSNNNLTGPTPTGGLLMDDVLSITV